MKVTVNVDCIGRWFERKTYDIPDDVVGAQGIDNAIDNAIEADHFDAAFDADIETGDWDYHGPRPQQVLDIIEAGMVWREPTKDSQWITIGEHRWLSDGHFASREDGPRPTHQREWGGLLEGPQLKGLGKLLQTPEADGFGGSGTFDARFTPLLKVGTVSPRSEQGMGFVYVDGEVVAIVMGMSGQAGTVDRYGDTIEKVTG